jgi:hypothetical protein
MISVISVGHTLSVLSSVEIQVQKHSSENKSHPEKGKGIEGLIEENPTQSEGIDNSEVIKISHIGKLLILVGFCHVKLRKLGKQPYQKKKEPIKKGRLYPYKGGPDGRNGNRDQRKIKNNHKGVFRSIELSNHII